MNLGERLIHLRKERNMTQEDLAKSLKISRGAVSMWEINQRTPDPETLQKIADFFGCSVDYLLGRTDEPRPPAKDNHVPLRGRDEPPTEVELEEFLKQQKISLIMGGETIDEDIRQDLLDFARFLVEKKRKARGEKK